jgi:LCP family protein required for cell wall assembly
MGTKNNNIKSKVNKSKSKKATFRILIASSVILASSGLGIFASTFHNVITAYNKTSDDKISLGTFAGIKKAVTDVMDISEPLTEPVNILVLGSDISYSRGRPVDNSPTRSDTMMLARIDPVSNSVNILSIPRDTRVLIPEHRYHDKINAAFAYGGEKMARRVVANLTGCSINHFLALRVNGLINMVDILGGIEIDVDKDMRYVDHTAKLDIDIKKGKQTLDGKQAHHYIRFRHDAIGDIGRVQRQQKFISAVTAKLLNPSILVKLPKLVEAARENVMTDMSDKELLKLANFARKIQRENIKMVMLPGRFGNIGGASYWLMDEEGSRELITDMFPDSMYATAQNTTSNINQDPNAPVDPLPNKRKYRITVLNGSNEPRLASKASRILREKGWTVWSIAESKNPVTKTQLIVQTGKNKAVPFLTESLGLPIDLINASVGDIYSDYTIIVGNDFAEYIKQLQSSNDVKSTKLQ